MSDLAVPPPSLLRSAWLPILRIFVQRALPLLRQGTLISWFRTPELNRRVGGDPDSQHLFGIAWDLALVENIQSEAPERLEFTIAEVARALGLVAVPGDDTVHVQLFPAGTLGRFGIRFPQ